MLKKCFVVLMGACLAAGCASTEMAPKSGEQASAANLPLGDGVLATLWQMTSAEYQASTRQAWASARLALDAALADKSLSAATEQKGKFQDLPPAVIVDVDETVLDNSPFQARMIRAGTGYNRPAWDAWVEEASAEAIPGALEFARYAAQRGVTLFYVTNRDAPGELATRRNLQETGFPLYRSIDYLLMRGEQPDWTSDKSSRRAHVAQRYRIVLLAGDDFNDFVSGTRVEPAARRELAAKYADWWGSRWIMLPNPAYGSWDRATYGYDRNLPAAEIGRRRMEALGEPSPKPLP